MAPKLPSFIGYKTRSGVMLLDVIMGAAMLGLFMTAIGTSFLFGQISFLRGGDRTNAVFRTEKAIEALRSIRDGDFDDLTVGTHGIRIGPGGTWELTAEPVTEGGYTTSVTITSVDSDTIEATAKTTWSFGMNRSGSTLSTSRITNWRIIQSIGNWESISLDGQYIDGGTPGFNRIAVSGNYAFVTCSCTAGLYIFDISNTASPTRVATSFSLGANAHGVEVVSNVLYVVVEDDSNELQSFDITSPSTLSLSDQVDTHNVLGSSRARSVDYFNGNLYAGSVEDVSSDEFYSFSVSTGGVMTQLDQMDKSASYYGISLHEGYAYLASSEDIAELTVIDVFDPSDLQDAPGVGYNLTDVHDSTDVIAFGTGVLLTRQNGLAIEELVLFDIAAGPVPTATPKFHEIGGVANGVDIEPGQRYAFIASDNATKELQVVVPDKLTAGVPAEVSFYDSANGAGKDAYYDMAKDRTYLITDDSFEVIQPGS